MPSPYHPEARHPKQPARPRRTWLRRAAIGVAGLVVLAAAAIPVTQRVMTRVPDGITPVTGFDAARYMGEWFEIARLDHRFERGMTDVTARYTLNDDGTVKVVNRGLRDGAWNSIEGVARFRGSPDVASLAVSFFPLFPGGYHVFALDQDYRWAVISGPSRDYLWILAREPQMDQATYDRLLGIARENGFAVDRIIRVSHDTPAGS